MSPGIIAAVLALGAVAVAAAIFARRAWLVATALERQLMDTRAQQAEQHREDWERKQASTNALTAQISCLRDETASRLDDATRRLDQLGVSTDALSERMSQASADARELHSQVTDHARELSARVTKIAEAVEIVTRKPLYDFPTDSARLETKTEEEVLAFAESLAVLRPLVPYPKWYFDSDWANPDLAFLLRQRLWRYFFDRKIEAPLVTRWHFGTRLCLYLGNDLSRQIFIAGCIDPNEFAFLDRFLQPRMTFFDAGANEGIYTVFAAKRVGREGSVWAFEPSRREVARLKRNLELNDLSARIFELALADRAGEAELTVAAYGHEGLNTLGTFVHDIEEGSREMVQVARLD